uniref:Uncharacterized protein n=1 Tax=Helianthus annuus TaxID=4232 RepID=A0A251V8U5_HELAN
MSNLILFPTEKTHRSPPPAAVPHCLTTITPHQTSSTQTHRSPPPAAVPLTTEHHHRCRRTITITPFNLCHWPSDHRLHRRFLTTTSAVNYFHPPSSTHLHPITINYPCFFWIHKEKSRS